MTLLLHDIFPIAAPNDYKLHFTRWNGAHQPLDVWVRDRAEWQGWHEYRPVRNAFNRPYIFTLIHFYPEPETWLFGGIFRVVRRHPARYEVALTDHGAGFIGRLKLRAASRPRPTRVAFEKHYGGLEVQEILRAPYAGRVFPGFESLELSFASLKALSQPARPDWKAALVLITEPGAGSRLDPARLAERLGLSRVESQVAAGVAEGRSVRELAQALGQTAGAVRWHLHQIYRKQGLARQADLVRLVLSATMGA